MNNGTTIRELSSVGSERLPYKQRVGGSTPSAPTKKDLFRIPEEVFFYVYVPPECYGKSWGKSKTASKSMCKRTSGEKSNCRFWKRAKSAICLFSPVVTHYFYRM